MKAVLLLASIVVLVAFSFCGLAAAAEPIAIIKDGSLVIAETKAVVPDVPAGITAEQALALFSGRIKEVSVKAETSAGSVDSFSALKPWLVSSWIFKDRIIAFSDGHFVSREVLRVEEMSNGESLAWNVICLVVPMAAIFTISHFNAVNRAKRKNLLIFHGVVLSTTSIIYGLALVAGPTRVALVLAVACVVALVTYASKAVSSTNLGMPHEYGGIAAGASAGAWFMAGHLASYGSPFDFANFLVFLAIVQLVAYFYTSAARKKAAAGTAVATR